MDKPETPIFAGIVSVLLILLLPLAGVVISGQDASHYLQFPPVPVHSIHAPFSWPVFILLVSFILYAILPPAVHIIRNRKCAVSSSRDKGSSSFPWWGWWGTLFCAAAWIIAWSRFPFFASIQRYTFFPLWISYIVIINAITWKRTGSCLLTNSTRYLGLLFPLSALFWWSFEYLNRFTANWYYNGIPGLSRAGYITEASIAFSTVLPAVASTAELIRSMPQLYAGMESYIIIKKCRGRLFWTLTLLVSSSGIAMIGVYPEILFPLLWISPLLIFTSLTSLAGRKSLLSGTAGGDWRTIIIYALSGLMCGFFWEMWNIYSMAGWIYSIPYVHAFKIFEMPITGYAGYIPFGLECAVVAGLIGCKE